MADKSFGVKELNLISASGTPTITSPNSVNIDATNVAISTDITVGGMVSLGAGTSISSPGTNVLTFGTNSTEKVRILSNGRVAIGDVTANSQLDVHGGDGISITSSGDTFLQSRTTGTTGTNYLEFKDSGGGSGAISYHHDGDSLRFKVNGSERARITSSGALGIGTDNPYDSKLQVFGKQRVSASAKNLTTDFFVLSSTENSSNSNDLIFRQRASDNDWEIEAVEQGIGYRNVWIKNGNLKFTSGKGIDFSATSDGPNVSSELLDDYEEGTFEPIFRAASGTFNTVTYHGDTGGRYTKVGNLVMVTGCVRISGGTLDTSNQSSSDTLCIGGLPFNNNARTNGDNADNHGTLRVPVWSGSNCPNFIQARQNVNFCNLYFIGNIGAIHSTSQVSQLTNQSMVQFTLVYTSG